MAINIYSKDKVGRLSAHFTSDEFCCPCSHCTAVLIDSELVRLLERMRKIVGCPLQVNSGFRCDHHQEELTNQGYPTAKNSMHVKGRAADVSTGHHSGNELAEAARKAGFKAVGVGATFVHVDTREDKDYSWKYPKGVKG